MKKSTKAGASTLFLLFIPCFFPLLAPRSARAVEVSLEENRAERGNIGYVDLQLLFRLYPDTQKAKQNFEEVVRQAEEQVNIRKAEILGLRAELARLRVEREFAVKNSAGATPANYVAAPPAPAPPVAATPAPAVSSPTTTVSASTAAVSASTAAAQVSASSSAPTGVVSRPAPAATSPAAEPAPLLINLPGLTPDSAAPAAPAENSTAAANNAVAQIDSKIQDTTKNLDSKEGEFKTYQAQVEKNLLDLESRRTEILLGKIYGAVREVAHGEGVSVVVDKSQILFGHKAVDLTDKVLEKLKSQPSQQ